MRKTLVYLLTPLILAGSFDYNKIKHPARPSADSVFVNIVQQKERDFDRRIIPFLGFDSLAVERITSNNSSFSRVRGVADFDSSLSARVKEDISRFFKDCSDKGNNYFLHITDSENPNKAIESYLFCIKLLGFGEGGNVYLEWKSLYLPIKEK